VTGIRSDVVIIVKPKAASSFWMMTFRRLQQRLAKAVSEAGAGYSN
jgi:RNase P protein component